MWRLSEPARLDLVLQRRVRGRLRSAGKPVRIAGVRSGNGRVRLTRIARSLANGRYAIRVVATDAAGNRSAPAGRLQRARR